MAADKAAPESIHGQPNKVLELMHQQLTLTAADALKRGIVTKLLDDGFKIPDGAAIANVPLLVSGLPVPAAPAASP